MLCTYWDKLPQQQELELCLRWESWQSWLWHRTARRLSKMLLIPALWPKMGRNKSRQWRKSENTVSLRGCGGDLRVPSGRRKWRMWHFPSRKLTSVAARWWAPVRFVLKSKHTVLFVSSLVTSHGELPLLIITQCVYVVNVTALQTEEIS